MKHRFNHIAAMLSYMGDLICHQGVVGSSFQTLKTYSESNTRNDQMDLREYIYIYIYMHTCVV